METRDTTRLTGPLTVGGTWRDRDLPSFGSKT